MIIIALSAIWVSFICYLIWYVAVANHNVPITHEEAKTLSKIHKKTTHCNSHKWHSIPLPNGKIASFECKCGYKYKQTRPIVSRTRKDICHLQEPNRISSHNLLSKPSSSMGKLLLLPHS